MKFVATSTALSVLLSTSITTAAASRKDTIRDDESLMNIYGASRYTYDDRQLDNSFVTTGPKKTLVVRFKDNTEYTPPSLEEITDRFFAVDQRSFKNQMESCSYGNLEIVPSTQPVLEGLIVNSSPGVVSAFIDIDVTSQADPFVSIGAAREKLKRLYGNDYKDKFDIIIGCLPPGESDQVADQFEWTYFSRERNLAEIFQFGGDQCGNVPSLMYVYGYYLGLGFDPVIVDTGFSDLTGQMGFTGFDDYSRCYNPANSYQLDWYPGAYDSLDEQDLLQKTYSLKLKGVADYDKGGEATDAVVSFRIDHGGDAESGGIDWYIGYNRKTGITRDTITAGDKIHLLQKANSVQSNTKLVATLGDRDGGDPNFPFLYSFRFGTSVVKLDVTNIDGTLAFVTIITKSIMTSIETQSLANGSPQSFVLNSNIEETFNGAVAGVDNGIGSLRIKDKGAMGGSDYYIEYKTSDNDVNTEIGEVANAVNLIKKQNGPYVYGEKEVLKTLTQGKTYSWQVGVRRIEIVVSEIGGSRATINLVAIDSPTDSPTTFPTISPTASPTGSPTGSPTARPTGSPTGSPTASPTGSPTARPTASPTASPTIFSCENNSGTFKYQGVKVSCADLLSFDESDVNKRCSNSKYVDNCPANCNPRCATQSPTARPSSIPSAPPRISCENNPDTFKYQGVKVSCTDLLSFDESDVNNRCTKSKYVDNCPANCNPQCATQIPTASPSQCEDKSKKFKIDVNGSLKTKDCNWVA